MKSKTIFALGDTITTIFDITGVVIVSAVLLLFVLQSCTPIPVREHIQNLNIPMEGEVK